MVVFLDTTISLVLSMKSEVFAASVVERVASTFKVALSVLYVQNVVVAVVNTSLDAVSIRYPSDVNLIPFSK